jgi:hypothetical protein
MVETVTLILLTWGSRKSVSNEREREREPEISDCYIGSFTVVLTYTDISKFMPAQNTRNN